MNYSPTTLEIMQELEGMEPEDVSRIGQLVKLLSIAPEFTQRRVYAMFRAAPIDDRHAWRARIDTDIGTLRTVLEQRQVIQPTAQALHELRRQGLTPRDLATNVPAASESRLALA